MTKAPAGHSVQLNRIARAGRTSGGFTLIELLVVLLLIGVIATFAVLNIGSRPDPRLETEARRLITVLELASETAVIQGRELGLMIDRAGYRFARLEDGEWLVISGAGDRVLRPHDMPEDITMEWIADGLPGEREPGAGSDEEDMQPVILLLSSGELSPFRLALTWQDRNQRQGWMLEGTMTGTLTLQQEEDPRP